MCADPSANTNDFKIWEMKKLLKKLVSYKGTATSMVTLFVPKNSEI